MAKNFDRSKYQEIFEQRFGKGSYSAGLSSASKLGETQAKAAIAKEEYKRRLEALEKARKEALEQQEKDIENGKIYGMPAKEASSMIKKAQAQGRGGHYPTRENQLIEKKNTKSASVDLNKLTPYQEQLRGLAPSWDEKGKKKEKSLLGKLGDFITSKDVDGDGERDGLLGAVDRFIVPISKGATDSFIPGNTERMAKNNPDNPVVKAAQKDRGLETDVLNAAGMIGAFAAPYSGAYKAADLAVNKIPKLANMANPYAKKAVTGALAGGMAETGISATNELANSEANDMRDYAIRTGLGVAGGAILDPALHGIANIIRKGRAARGAASEPLGLPEPQRALPETPTIARRKPLELPAPKRLEPSLKNLNRAFKQPGGLESPIPAMPKSLSQMITRSRLENEGLNFGYNLKNTPQARLDTSPFEASADPMRRGQGYWQSRYEDFAREVNARHDLNDLTPEALEDLWSSFAKYDEPVRLEDVVDLAYPKGFEEPPIVKADIPETPARTIKDDLREDPQINNMVRDLFPPPTPEPPISRRATLGEMVDRMEQLLPKKPEATPLNSLKGLGLKNPTNEVAATFEAIRPLGESLNPLREVDPTPLGSLKGLGLKSDGKQVVPAAEPLKPLNELLPLDSAKGKGFEPITPGSADEEGLINLFEGINFGKLKDINGIQGYTSDVYRNSRDVFGSKYPKIKEMLLDPFDKSKKEYVGLQQAWTDRLDKEIVKGLGIKKNSKLSGLVQDYGEKTITLAELKQAAPADWKKVVQADQWFRQVYNDLIDQVNVSRLATYPNNPEKLVPKREDYYRHFRELNGLEGLRNMFDTPAGIDPQLVGTSDFTNPNTKWASFMQKRGSGPYKSDAVGGFLNYLPSAAYAIKIDPHIPKFKQFANVLREETGASRNLNSYIEFLDDFSRDLAGKTNFLDRPVQKIVGRKAFAGLQWLNTRVKKNAVLGNLGSTLAQVANIPNGVAFAKQHSLPGAAKTLKSIFLKNEEAAQSGFLKERFSQDMYQKFNTRLIDQPEKFAAWIMSSADRIGTSFVWNSAYQKGLAQKVKDPVKFADDHTRNLVAGRGIGEVPLLQKSKVFQFIAPFQLEVANLWKVQRDFVKEKDFGAIVTLYLGAWLLNKGMEETRGSKVVFDPIDAITDAFTDEDLSGWEKAGRVGGEILSNVPLGQTLANFYPEYGTKHLPTREDFFGDRDPNRFGSGLLVAKGVQDPLFKLLPPFGGAQIQKSLKGISALQDEGVYNKDQSKLKYPVSNDIGNGLKGTLFGPGALRESRDYYDNERKPLGTKQTEEYKALESSGLGQEYYDQVMRTREIESIEEKMKEITMDASLSEQDRMAKLMELMKKLQEIKK